MQHCYYLHGAGLVVGAYSSWHLPIPTNLGNQLIAKKLPQVSSLVSMESACDQMLL